uniref:Uncharacterized protein n=1 Tax=Lepeophtheirus salmonis TaxID=72036 RepID=A0A0K2T9H7_LEPSM
MTRKMNKYPPAVFKLVDANKLFS